jgi:hypothetical protein
MTTENVEKYNAALQVEIAKLTAILPTAEAARGHEMQASADALKLMLNDDQLTAEEKASVLAPVMRDLPPAFSGVITSLLDSLVSDIEIDQPQLAGLYLEIFTALSVHVVACHPSSLVGFIRMLTKTLQYEDVEAETVLALLPKSSVSKTLLPQIDMVGGPLRMLTNATSYVDFLKALQLKIPARDFLKLLQLPLSSKQVYISLKGNLRGMLQTSVEWLQKNDCNNLNLEQLKQLSTRTTSLYGEAVVALVCSISAAEFLQGNFDELMSRLSLIKEKPSVSLYLLSLLPTPENRSLWARCLDENQVLYKYCAYKTGINPFTTAKLITDVSILLRK